jgi:hypothetical protein
MDSALGGCRGGQGARRAAAPSRIDAIGERFGLKIALETACWVRGDGRGDRPQMNRGLKAEVG